MFMKNKNMKTLWIGNLMRYISLQFSEALFFHENFKRKYFCELLQFLHQ